MMALIVSLCDDEAGFIISAEMVLVVSIAVLAMVVGLSEVAWGVNQELEDTGSAFGSITQSYFVNGLTGHVANMAGSFFQDLVDFCDAAGDITGSQPMPEK